MEQLSNMPGPLSGLLQAAYYDINRRNEPQGMYEYLLVAKVDKDMQERILEEQQFFHDKNITRKAIDTHLTMAKFYAREAMEDTVGRWIQRICGQQKSFRVVLNNFSGVPPHTVYIRVQNHQPFQVFAKQLNAVDSYIQSNGCPPAKLISRPRLTIANNLPEDVYRKALFVCAQREFTGEFIVHELVLLRKKSRFDTGEKVNLFRLLPEVAPVFCDEQLMTL